MKLMTHQCEVVERARSQRRLAMFWDPGVGKTIAAFAICQERPMTTVVVCPRSIMRAAWEEDGAHFPNLSLVIFHGPPNQRRAQLREMGYVSQALRDHTILITTPETFKRHAMDLISVGVCRLIFDESSKLKNRKSAISKAVAAFADKMDEVYLLSGTPAPNCPSEYWSQLRALDPKPDGLAGVPGGRVLNFYVWSNRYLNASYDYVRFKGGHGQTTRVVSGYKVRDMDLFTALLARGSDRRSKADCLDIPEIQEIPVVVDMTEEETDAYQDVTEDLTVDGFEIEATAAVMKLRQITGGNVRAPEAEVWTQLNSSKLEACGELVDSLGAEPLILWTQFHVEADRVHQMLVDMGRRSAICDGRTKSPDLVIREFLHGQLDTIVAHPASLGHGVTLVRCGDRPCRYAVYFSLSYSYEQHTQSMDRLHRYGQHDHVTYYYLMARESLDMVIREALSRKEIVSRRVLQRLRDTIRQRNQANVILPPARSAGPG